MGVVPTTIIPTRARRILIARQRIVDLTASVGDSRVTTICAPAGSGKTTAALYWADRFRDDGRPVLWIAARPGFSDLPDFLSALKAAGLKAGLPWNDLEPVGHGVEWLAAPQGRRPVLVVDDAQLLDRETLDFLSQAIASARDALTTIIVSRGSRAVPVARLRSLGFLVEVGASDLSFTAAEATELLTRMAGAPLDSDELSKIIEDIQGWASGLVITGELYRRKTESRGVWTALSERIRTEFADYFYEEVLSLQPQAVREFLVDTSVLAELTPAACAAVTRCGDARALLDQLFDAGLFLAAVDQERSCYRYYGLFQAVIAGRLMDRTPARAAALHRRASTYFASIGLPLVALDHANASGDQAFIADQLEQVADELTCGGFLYRIEELGAALPWPVLSQRPRTMLALAWSQIHALSFAAAERLISAAETARDRGAQDGTLDVHEREQLDYLIRHRRLMLEAGKDNLAALEGEAEALLKEMGEAYPYLSCTLLAQLTMARRELYHFHDALKLAAESRRALGRPGSEYASIALKASVAPTLMVQGKTGWARTFLQEALQQARARSDGDGAGVAALPAIPLAALLYDAGELDQAAALVSEYLPEIRQWGSVDHLASGYLVQARLAFARNDVAGALSGLEEAHLVAIECGLNRLRVSAVVEQIRILLRSGQTEAAEAAFRRGFGRLDGEPVPTLNPTRCNESIAVAWLRIEIQRHRLTRARNTAARWLELARRSGVTRSAVTLELLLAQIAVLQGNRSEARRALRAALILAEPAGWIRPFIDEGEVISALLADAYANGPVFESSIDLFGRKLLSLTEGGGSPVLASQQTDGELGLMSRLAGREVDILTMVRGGLRNREIGDRLGLTEGTVKWYMQQIYDKLGVRRRPQAVLRARQLGLLG
jgi:LuxR family maltose regulon positive regulatory protein